MLAVAGVVAAKAATGIPWFNAGAAVCPPTGDIFTQECK